MFHSAGALQILAAELLPGMALPQVSVEQVVVILLSDAPDMQYILITAFLILNSENMQYSYAICVALCPIVHV